MVEATGSVPSTPQRISFNASPKTIPASSMAVPSGTAPKRNYTKAHSTVNVPVINKLDVIPVIVPRTNMRSEQAADSRKELGLAARTMPFSLQSKATDFRKLSNIRDEVDKQIVSVLPEFTGSKAAELSSASDRNIFPAAKSLTQGVSAEEKSMKDDRFIGSSKHEMNSMMESSASYQHETCMYLNLLELRAPNCLIYIYPFWLHVCLELLQYVAEHLFYLFALNLSCHNVYISLEIELSAYCLNSFFYFYFKDDTRGHKVNRDACSIESQKGGKSYSYVVLMFVSDLMKYL
jgi:hypothetical protein